MNSNLKEENKIYNGTTSVEAQIISNFKEKKFDYKSFKLKYEPIQKSEFLSTSKSIPLSTQEWKTKDNNLKNDYKNYTLHSSKRLYVIFK